MQEPIFVTREMLTALRPLVRNLVVIPPAPASSSNEPLGLTAHLIAADALATPIREAIRARSVKRNRRPSLPEAAATKHMSAVTEEPIVAVPIVLPGRSPLVDELSGEARDVAPPPEARHSTIQHRDARRVSIAILPFSLASSEGGTPAFADMLAEDIAVAFHRQQGVEVRLPPTITDQHLTSGNIEQLKEGGLSYVLVGSIAVMGQEIRLTAKLLDLRAGCFVWIQHFNPQLPQSLQTVTELGQEVAARVLAGLSQTYATGSQ